ncbi:hypothetical protein [Kribbella sp. NPDC050470]|uniref:hypothetical protein n=1 Tax=unclassified Kribbella TaxID=2644121 RepID=UPI0037A760F4
MSPQGGRGETANVYYASHELFAERLAEAAALFIQFPKVQATSLEIRNGRIEIQAEGVAGVLKSWAHAVPDHKLRESLVPTSYGADEADVIESDHIRVVVRRPLVGPGGVSV